MNWKQNKNLFSIIINNNYSIQKDYDSHDILYINWEHFSMKCKYFLAFTIDDDKNIIWSCDNPFIDQKTKYLSQCIKSNISTSEKISNEIMNDLKKLLQNDTSFIFEEHKINAIWCIIGEHKKYKQFYIITEIIYL